MSATVKGLFYLFLATPMELYKMEARQRRIYYPRTGYIFRFGKGWVAFKLMDFLIYGGVSLWRVFSPLKQFPVKRKPVKLVLVVVL